MQIRNRTYNHKSDDFKRLCQFIIEDNRIKKEYFNWSLGRIVDWKYGLWHEEKLFPMFSSKNANLWVNYFDELVGFAISENGDNMFFIFVKDAYAHLSAEILQWVIAHWSTRKGGLLTEVTEVQTAQIRTLERFGFVSKGVCEVTRAFDLHDEIAQPALPEGFTFSDMAVNYDPVGKATLQVNAWGNRSVTNLDLLACEYVRESPIYKPEFDLSILNPQGKHVAGCEAFIDYENSEAEIERVCTHSEYRRRGLAQAVILECFRRLNSVGIMRAYITGGSEATIDLYGKLGHTCEVKRIHYELASKE